MVIDPRYFDYLKIPTQDYTLTMEQFSDLVHPDDRKVLFDALAGQLTGKLVRGTRTLSSAPGRRGLGVVRGAVYLCGATVRFAVPYCRYLHEYAAA